MASRMRVYLGRCATARTLGFAHPGYLTSQAGALGRRGGVLAIVLHQDGGCAVDVEVGGQDRWKRRTAAKASEAFISGLT
jgi:hypothetical protein